MTKARFQFKFLRLKINFWWFRLVSVLAKGSGQRFWPKVLAKGSGQRFWPISSFSFGPKPKTWFRSYTSANASRAIFLSPNLSICLYGLEAVHKLCRLKICNHWPHPPWHLFFIKQGLSKVHIFWECNKILQNIHLIFEWHYIGQK